MKAPLFSLQYEPDIPSNYSEPGVAEGAKLEKDPIADEDINRIHRETKNMTFKQTLHWIETHKRELKPGTAVLGAGANTVEQVKRKASEREVTSVYVERPLHTIRDLNQFLDCVNEVLPMGGYACFNSWTARLKREIIMNKYPKVIRWIVYLRHVLWHIICPQLRLGRKVYMAVTHGHNRTYNRVEILGRICRAGFEIIDEEFRLGYYNVLAKKVSEPIQKYDPRYTNIIRLNRIGKGGKPVQVYKFRTMYPYSEYLQSYIYEYQKLDDGGKFVNDYRVTQLGKFLRHAWLDEVPMILNLLEGKMKLVGVRPLSKQYFSLYSKEMQELREKVKPGLIPPFYYEKETPKTIDDIQASERRYIEAYLAHPFRTDWRYFFGTITNILTRGKHSK